MESQWISESVRCQTKKRFIYSLFATLAIQCAHDVRLLLGRSAHKAFSMASPTRVWDQQELAQGMTSTSLTGSGSYVLYAPALERQLSSVGIAK